MDCKNGHEMLFRDSFSDKNGNGIERYHCIQCGLSLNVICTVDGNVKYDWFTGKDKLISSPSDSLDRHEFKLNHVLDVNDKLKSSSSFSDKDDISNLSKKVPSKVYDKKTGKVLNKE